MRRRTLVASLLPIAALVLLVACCAAAEIAGEPTVDDDFLNSLKPARPRGAIETPNAPSTKSPPLLGRLAGKEANVEQHRRALLTAFGRERARARAARDLPPDVNRNFTQIVQARGYPVEEHTTVTEDGYVLTLFRIPAGRNASASPMGRKQPVLLQHGLLDSAITWIINMPDQSLSFILADAGYDVWLGNNRGTVYSLSHKNMSTSDPRFWRFSWDEMAKYDIPALIGYVKNFTGFDKISYVGHSEGTIQMFAALSSIPTVADSLHIFAGLGPVITVGHINSTPLKILADFDVAEWFQYFGFEDFLPPIDGRTDPLLYFLFAEFCVECGICCDDIVELICGEHQGAFNDSRMPVVATHEPGGTSVQNMAKWAQGVRTGLFQMYDYGPQGNEQRYGQKTPPLYDIGKISPDLPIALWSGGADLLADPIDVKALVDGLTAKVRAPFWKIIAPYAHLDFVWAIDANELIYSEVLTLLQKYATD